MLDSQREFRISQAVGILSNSRWTSTGTMAFIILTCPGCGRRIIMDETDGKGYCMYCGLQIDAGRTDAEYLDPQSCELLDVVINGDGNGHEDEPWFPAMKGSVDLLMEGRVEEAAMGFASALEGQDAQTVTAMKDAMAEFVAQWVLRTVFEGRPYKGGMMAVAPMLEVEGEMDTSPAILIETIFEAICNSVNIIGCPEDALNMTESLFSLLREYLTTEPSMTNQALLLDEFVKQSEVFSEVADQVSDGRADEQREAIARMRSAAECLQSAMTEEIPRQPHERLEDLEGYWAGKGIGIIGKDAAGILGSMSGRDVSEEDALACREYVGLYMHPVL